jgi:hypothetical protein
LRCSCRPRMSPFTLPISRDRHTRSPHRDPPARSPRARHHARCGRGAVRRARGPDAARGTGTRAGSFGGPDRGSHRRRGSWDADMREGWWPDGERPGFPLVLGTDGSGTIAAVGSRVRRFTPASAYMPTVLPTRRVASMRNT